MASIAYDVTHLMHRRAFMAPSGIERVDFTFARSFDAHPETLGAAVHYGIAGPVVLPASSVRAISVELSEKWRLTAAPENDANFQAVRQWLINQALEPGPRHRKRETRLHAVRANSVSLARTLGWSALRSRSAEIPEGSVYLNVAQYALEFGLFFEWMRKRRDLAKVFFIHDLLPLDFPEFWPKGYEQRFSTRISRAIALGSAFLTASRSVRDRLHAELKAAGRGNVPVFSKPLPTPYRANGTNDADLADVPYFLAIGTIEPRKNHLLLLSIWRELASQGGRIPKLIFVGKRGWTNAEVVNVIDHAKGIRHHVAECSGLGDSALERLIRHARAVLIPSYAEGFGLPIVEALACGTPVLAADIRVFREVSGDHAIFRDHLDGIGWLRAIHQLADTNSHFAREARLAAAAFTPTRAPQYFDEVRAFLAAL